MNRRQGLARKAHGGVYNVRIMKMSISVAKPRMKKRTPFQLVASRLSSPSRSLVKIRCGCGGGATAPPPSLMEGIMRSFRIEFSRLEEVHGPGMKHLGDDLSDRRDQLRNGHSQNAPRALSRNPRTHNHDHLLASVVLER
jgi:hypothetical protein